MKKYNIIIWDELEEGKEKNITRVLLQNECIITDETNVIECDEVKIDYVAEQLLQLGVDAIIPMREVQFANVGECKNVPF